jgi:hypothetical protein
MKIVKTFIWLGFIALLAVSIPKTAWVFRSWEGEEVLLATLWGYTFDVLWLVPLFVSFCIDGLILSLTYAISTDKTRLSQGFMWCFVALLAGFSYYCNLVYNLAHRPTGSIWDAPITGGIAPLIISAIPLFALFYTLILTRINGNAETLEQKAERLEQEQDVKARIRQAKPSVFDRLADGAKGAIAAGKEVAKEMRRDAHNGTPLPTQPAIQTEGQVEQDVELPQEVQTGKLEEVKPSVNGSEREPADASLTLQESLRERYPSLVSLLEKGQMTATLQEVAHMTGYSVKWLKDRREKKFIRCTSRNTDLLLLESVLLWLNTIPKDKQKEPGSVSMKSGAFHTSTGGTLSQLPTIQLDEIPAPNGHH